jgi:hypothetical protein
MPGMPHENFREGIPEIADTLPGMLVLDAMRMMNEVSEGKRPRAEAAPVIKGILDAAAEASGFPPDWRARLEGRER